MIELKFATTNVFNITINCDKKLNSRVINI